MTKHQASGIEDLGESMIIRQIAQSSTEVMKIGSRYAFVWGMLCMIASVANVVLLVASFHLLESFELFWLVLIYSSIALLVARVVITMHTFGNCKPLLKMIDNLRVKSIDSSK